MRRDLLTGAPITPPEPGSTTVYIIKRDETPRTKDAPTHKRHAVAARDADKERQALHDFAILLQYIDSHQNELAAYAQVTRQAAGYEG